MLIEKKAVSPNDIVVFRILTGEEIIGKVVSLNEANGGESREITVARPIVLQMQMVAPNQAGIAFAPFMVGAEEDGKYTFSYAKLLLKPMAARKDVANNYLKATTGLEMPGLSSLSGINGSGKPS